MISVFCPRKVKSIYKSKKEIEDENLNHQFTLITTKSATVQPKRATSIELFYRESRAFTKGSKKKRRREEPLARA